VKAIHNCTYGLAGRKALEFLLKHDGGLGITPAMLEAADSVEVMVLLLDHQPKSHITADVVMNIIEREHERLGMLRVLVEYGKTVEFTAKIREALDAEFEGEDDQETKALFYKLERRHI